MLDLVKSFLRSRKFWLTLVNVAVILGGGKLNLTPEQIALIAGSFTVLVLAIMGEDVASKIKITLPEVNASDEKNEQIVSIVTDIVTNMLKKKEDEV